MELVSCQPFDDSPGYRFGGVEDKSQGTVTKLDTMPWSESISSRAFM